MKTKYQLLVVLSSFQLSISGFAQVQNSGDFRMHSGAALGVFGDFTNNGNFQNNLGTVYAVGTNSQTFNGTNLLQAADFVINKGSGSLQLDQELQVSGVLTFTNGIIYSDRADKASEFVHFLDGASFVTASDASHIDGVIRKTGNDAFSFPVGDDNNFQSIGIAAPALVTDSYTAEYIELDPDPLYDGSLKEILIDHISNCEYWILDRTNGTSDVAVTLMWDLNSCGVTNLNDLLVAKWDGTEWKNHGNSLTTGNTSLGTVTSAGAVASFGPFTLGSTTTANPLPTELTYFKAKEEQRIVELEWETASEIENDFFTVERSNDAINFELLTTVDGAGNSNSSLNYDAVDQDPIAGVSYYRLTQTDFDGNQKRSEIISININDLDGEEALSIYPNPALPEFFNLELPHVEESFELYLMDDLGKVVYSEVIYPLGNRTLSIYPPKNLLSGHYNVKLVNQDKFWTSHLVVL